jgi:exonuclease SbcD
VKILHTSDWHVGRAIRGRSRAEEHRAVLAEIASIGAVEGVDVVIVAGDLFDSAAPTPEAERIVYRGLLDLSEVAPVVLVAGNHDNPRRLEAVTPLLELGRMKVGTTLKRPDEGGVLFLRHLGLRVGLLPWLNHRSVVRADELIGGSSDEHAQQYEDRMRRVLEALSAGMTLDEVNVMVGHVMVHGAMPVGSERTVHIFGYAIPAAVFPGHLSYVALGHLHRQQRLPAPAPVWYSGSPLQLDFGETGDEKGVLIVEAKPGLPAIVRPVALTSGRRLRLLRGTLEQVAALAEAVADDYVKVELEERQRAGLADEVRSLIPSAVEVVLARLDEETGDNRPARLGRQPAELFEEYLRHHKVEDERLSALFSVLLEEAHEA